MSHKIVINPLPFMFVRMVINILLLRRTSHFILSTVTKKPDSYQMYAYTSERTHYSFLPPCWRFNKHIEWFNWLHSKTVRLLILNENYICVLWSRFGRYKKNINFVQIIIFLSPLQKWNLLFWPAVK